MCWYCVRTKPGEEKICQGHTVGRAEQGQDSQEQVNTSHSAGTDNTENISENTGDTALGHHWP